MRNAPIGVKLKPDEPPEKLGADIQRLSIIVLEFAKFRDGRPFSWARQLRTRLGYKGEIRGAGDFLYDQMNYMHRTGFDAFEVPDGFTLADYEKGVEGNDQRLSTQRGWPKDHPRPARG